MLTFQALLLTLAIDEKMTPDQPTPLNRAFAAGHRSPSNTMYGRNLGHGSINQRTTGRVTAPKLLMSSMKEVTGLAEARFAADPT